MNIAIFTDTYGPQINGVATSTQMLEKELVARGHNVYIFTTTDPHARTSPPNVFRLPSMPFIFLPTHRFGLIYPPKLLLKTRKLKLDIIHTQTEFALGVFGRFIARFFKIPQVHTYHTVYEDYVHYIANGHLITPKMARKYSRIFCHGARAVIAPTAKTVDLLLSYGVERPLRIIPTGIDFEPFRRGKYTDDEINEIKCGLGVDLSAPVVVSVGRVAKEKSLDVVLGQFPALLKKLPNAKFIIVGGGPLLADLKTMAQTLGVADSVFFTGPQPWAQIGKYYQLGDVFVSASTSETQGLTYIEAMAAKVAVCAKKDPAVDDIVINGETGYSFTQTEEIADTLYAALSDAEKRAQITERALANIVHLSSNRFGEAVEGLYTQLVRAFPPRKRKKGAHRSKAAQIE